MQTNFNFLLIGIIIIFGFFSETHNVRTLKADNPNEKAYQTRLDFREYLTNWIKWSIKTHSIKMTAPILFSLHSQMAVLHEAVTGQR